MVLYIAVCDDEPVFTEHIRNLLVSDSILKGYELNIEIYQSGEALLKAWDNGCSFDLIFLDILLDAGTAQKRMQGGRMPENQDGKETLNGFETAELLRKAGCSALLVFLTSLSSYVQKGYEVRAFRYLLKSQMGEELTRVIEDCRGRTVGSGNGIFITWRAISGWYICTRESRHFIFIRSWMSWRRSFAATVFCAVIKVIWCRSVMWQGGRKSSCGWRMGR